LYGATGKILRVDLSTKAIKTDQLNENTIQTYMGGKCLGAKILLEELSPGIDPFSSANKLIFAAGPLTGAPFAGHSRYVVMAKSPITGGWGESHAAGFFGPELKYAGYDAIVIDGKAETPMYLWLHNEEAELKDARKLWGKLTGEVQNTIRKSAKDNAVRVASIGPGGEKLVRYAAILSDLYCAAGRCGMGAVMGAKNLKAVAVRGTTPLMLADDAAFQDLSVQASSEAMDGWGQSLFEYGTGGDLVSLHRSGRLPTHAFRKSTFHGSEHITGETLTNTIMKDRATCPDCPDAHYRIVETTGQYVTDPAYGGPEYETLAAFGSLCLNDNLEVIAKANELCNKYSLDTIATGVTIAFAMECFENKILTIQDTDGIDLTWGNGDAIIAMIHKIAHREGVGDLLAEGVKRAAEKLGRGASAWALHVKGAELPMHEPRGKKGVGLTYATSDRGASHLQVYHDDTFENEGNAAPEIGVDATLLPVSRTDIGPKKVKVVKIYEDLMALYNSLVLCRFVFYPAGVSLKTFEGLFTAVTGWKMTAQELLRVGERSFNLTRTFNAREGFTRKDDTLPQRLTEPLSDGALNGETFSTADLQSALDLYYEYRGWDLETGWPTQQKLRQLDLEWAVAHLPS
jgi:aldehyde:ferredoxin oxidoreductase